MTGCRYIVGWLAALLPMVACGASSAQTTVKYVHTDALGSVVAMTDASGALVETTREYEPYGEQLVPAIKDGPGYTGHVQDAATGLVYMQQRYYDPMIGLFLSVDPVTAHSSPVGQFNRYRYADSNPYRFTDPDGRCARATGSMICGGAAGIAAMATTAKAIPTGARAETKTLSGVPAKTTSDDRQVVGSVNKGIEGARRRIDRAKDPLLNGAWNSTEWNWNPNHKELSGRETAAFINPALPNVVNVGRYFGKFADTAWKTTYHGVSFAGGSGALTFAALHEFGHVVQAGVGAPGPEREEAANAFAYRHTSPFERKDFQCSVCNE